MVTKTKHFLHNYADSICIWAYLMLIFYVAFMIGSYHSQYFGNNYQNLILAVTWSIIGSTEYTMWTLAQFYIYSRDDYQRGFDRREYHYIAILTPLFGAIFGLIVYSVLLGILEAKIAKINSLVIILLSSTIGFNHIIILGTNSFLRYIFFMDSGRCIFGCGYNQVDMEQLSSLRKLGIFLILYQG
jgi:hypothetical protein